MKVRLIKSFEFDAAHHLPCFPPGHKCREIHGHTMKVEVVIEGQMPPGQDYLIDFGDIKRCIEPIRAQLDHKLLNDIEGLGVPTVENLSRWIWDRLKPDLPLLAMLRVHETAGNVCEYAGE
jgi:6-pyruvoyltetrahydropterin/6-carboxytetrahydropterin synthase